MAFACVVGLTGCTTYVERPAAPVTYSPPPPTEVYVQQPAPPAPVTVEVTIRDERDFYEPLSRYGRWEMIGGYGRCWVPGRVEADWRPYTNGHWERTEAGWYWVTEEPWGWATYHYGRWDFDPGYGWFWVPQTQWAPAWVSWHRGAGYLGWAPLHPSDRWASRGELEVSHREVPQRAYVFVEERRFLEPVRPTTVVNNTTIINKTVNITNIKVVNNTVINEGPRTQVIEQASGRKVQAVPVRELRRKTEVSAASEIRSRTPDRNERQAQPPPGRDINRQATDAAATRQQNDAQKRSAEAERNAQIEEARRAKEGQRRVQEQADRQKQEAARRAREDARLKAAQDEELRHQQVLERDLKIENDRRAREERDQAQKEAAARARGAAIDSKAEAGRQKQIEARRAKEDARLKAAQEAELRHKEALDRDLRVESERRSKESKAVQERPQERTNKIAPRRTTREQPRAVRPLPEPATNAPAGRP